MNQVQFLIILSVLIKIFATSSSVNPAEANALGEMYQKDQENGGNLSKPLISLYEISKQGEGLNNLILDNDICTAVEKVEISIMEMLSSGFILVDVAPIIGSLEVDPKKLVLAAIEKKSHTLLKLLQITYIWRDETQFHWFKALSYNSLWYDQEMWESPIPCPMNWRDHLWAICESDNGDLAVRVQKEIPSDTLKSFYKELLTQCVEYDAINVFKAMELNPIQLEEYFKIMSEKSSAKLLKLYQDHTELACLHLERFPFPKKLPANVAEFEFLTRNGHGCFPVDRFLQWFCREGRLDLLKHLHALDPKLIPDPWHLYFAADRGWLNIIQWAYQLRLVHWDESRNIATRLAINCHIHALDWMIKEDKLVIDSRLITDIVSAGALETLKWIDEKQPYWSSQHSWINVAAEKRHFSVLKWLHGKSGLSPNVRYLGSATVEMLEWLKDRDSTLISADLVYYGANNFDLLQWAHRNAPRSFFKKNIEELLRRARSKEMVAWLFKNFGLCPLELDWAYKAGDLETIQLAWRNHSVSPTSENIRHAAKGGHLDVIKWIYKQCPSDLDPPFALKFAIEYGRLEVASYLHSLRGLDTWQLEMSFIGLCMEGRLDVLKWAHAHEYGVPLISEIRNAITSGHLHILEWFCDTFLQVAPGSLLWRTSVEHDRHKVYKWLLEKYPEKNQTKIHEDFQIAFEKGYLGIVKVILEKYPSLIKNASEFRTNKKNHHIRQWFIVAGLVTK